MRSWEIFEEVGRTLLYHATSVANLEKMLAANSMGLPKVKKDPTSVITSFTRSYIFAARWRDYYFSKSSVIIALDRDKLSQRYAIKPHNDSPLFTRHGPEHTGSIRQPGEATAAEETISGVITNLESYIVSIDIMANMTNKFCEKHPLVTNHPKLVYEGRYVNVKDNPSLRIKLNKKHHDSVFAGHKGSIRVEAPNPRYNSPGYVTTSIGRHLNRTLRIPNMEYYNSPQLLADIERDKEILLDELARLYKRWGREMPMITWPKSYGPPELRSSIPPLKA